MGDERNQMLIPLTPPLEEGDWIDLSEFVRLYAEKVEVGFSLGAAPLEPQTTGHEGGGT